MKKGINGATLPTEGIANLFKQESIVSKVILNDN